VNRRIEALRTRLRANHGVPVAPVGCWPGRAAAVEPDPQLCGEPVAVAIDHRTSLRAAAVALHGWLSAVAIGIGAPEVLGEASAVADGAPARLQARQLSSYASVAAAIDPSNPVRGRGKAPCISVRDSVPAPSKPPPQRSAAAAAGD
jgi:hypothetical protein